MPISRRSLLKSTVAASAVSQFGTSSTSQAHVTPGVAEHRRIAVEEAYLPEELIPHWKAVIKKNPAIEKGFVRLAGGFLSDRPASRQRVKELSELGEARIHDMDANGIAKLVVSVNSPGVQPLEKSLAVEMARLTNEKMAAAVEKYPERFDALAALATQDPSAAAQEFERAVTKLGLKGALINSHTKGEFLDDPKFWEIFEAAEALDAPIYIHPRTPPPSMIEPYMSYGLDSAMWGFSAETGLHVMRMVMSGLFDRFPKLRIILGHAGEGIPFWLDRIDDRYMASLQIFGERNIGKLEKKPSEYVRENMYVTTSGMNFEDPVMFLVKVLGIDRVMFAADYPHESLDNRLAIDALPLPYSDIEKIFSGNAERVFSL